MDMSLMKKSFYKCFAISAFTLLLGCTSGDIENKEVQIKQGNTTAARTVYIDPNTGKITSPPVGAVEKMLNRATSSEPVILDVTVNKENGLTELTPRTPVKVNMYAVQDCEGNVKTTHHEGHDSASKNNCDTTK